MMEIELRSEAEPVVVTENDMVLVKNVELPVDFLEDLDKATVNGKPTVVILSKEAEICVVRDYKHGKERVEWEYGPWEEYEVMTAKGYQKQYFCPKCERTYIRKSWKYCPKCGYHGYVKKENA